MNVSRKFPVVFDWVIGEQSCAEVEGTDNYACVSENSECQESTNGPGHICNCSNGFQGNPYLPDGCQDIDECNQEIQKCYGICMNKIGNFTCNCPQGTKGNPYVVDGCLQIDDSNLSIYSKLGIDYGVIIPFLFLVISLISWIHRRRKYKQLKQKMFQQNGGLFLQDQIIDKDYADTFKIFGEEQLQSATNNYDAQNILGKGGRGIVYKGVLADGRLVAIKKSVTIDESISKEFAKEMLILSQINHVNVIKLLGCCLEIQVPMMVYEFASHGTLSDHMNHENRQHLKTWSFRLKIVSESAKALSYMHSEASPPILHGDIKPSNILLNTNYTAKVSDFGTSTFASKDKSRFMTKVQGTCGYLDPDYLRTGKLTEKSDVYSFGVVIVELLTGKKAIYRDEEDKETFLIVEFLSGVSENKIKEVLDPQFLNDGAPMDQIKVVVDIAVQCLSISGQERPTMSYISTVLEGLRRSETHLWAHREDIEENKPLLPQFPAYRNSNNNGEYHTMTKLESVNIEFGR